MNNICIVGRVTKDVELEETANGVKYARFNVAVPRGYKCGDGEKETDFFTCMAWKSTAEMIAKYFPKGKAIGINGSMHSRNYKKKDGTQQTIWELDVNSFVFPVTNKNDEAPKKSREEYAQDLMPIDDENCPF